ncbi:protein of unknown function [Candidatus Nitrotoga arctica]|uniref:Transposase n=1 Tax=Candidatus Nitrotoga arctica TaxID=453162 RepID=A0ABM8YW21_9PROT|nr:protein of unknown function [Candidatus Nitrotoga arctica]
MSARLKLSSLATNHYFYKLEQRPETKAKGDIVMRFMMLMIPKRYDSATPGMMPNAKAVEG